MSMPNVMILFLFRSEYFYVKSKWTHTLTCMIAFIMLMSLSKTEACGSMVYLKGYHGSMTLKYKFSYLSRMNDDTGISELYK